MVGRGEGILWCVGYRQDLVFKGIKGSNPGGSSSFLGFFPLRSVSVASLDYVSSSKRCTGVDMIEESE